MGTGASNFLIHTYVLRVLCVCRNYFLKDFKIILKVHMCIHFQHVPVTTVLVYQIPVEMTIFKCLHTTRPHFKPLSMYN